MPAILFILGFLFSIMFALLLALGGWASTIFLAKAISSSFRPSPVHHLLCLGVAIIGFVCLMVFFVSQKGIRYLNQSEHIVESLVSSNEAYVAQLHEVVSSGGQAEGQDAGELLPALVSQLKEQYPVLSRFVDTEDLSGDRQLLAQLKKAAQGRENISTTALVRFFSKSVIRHLKRPLVTSCWISIIVFLLFQFLQNVVVLRRANKSKAFVSNYLYNDSSEW